MLNGHHLTPAGLYHNYIFLHGLLPSSLPHGITVCKLVTEALHGHAYLRPSSPAHQLHKDNEGVVARKEEAAWLRERSGLKGPHQDALQGAQLEVCT